MNLFEQISNEIKAAQNIVVTSHKGPDGDAIGSALAMFLFLRKINKNVSVCLPDDAPHYLKSLNGTDQISFFDKNPNQVTEKLVNADLIFCLDYNAPDRLGKEMGEVLIKSSARRILIDHHPNPTAFCDVMYSDVSSSSTAQLVFELIEQSGNKNLLDHDLGATIYLGLVTDTGSFRFPSVSARTHEIVAELIKGGLKHYLVHEQVFDTNTIDKLRLRGYAIADKLELVPKSPVGLISLSKNELNKFNYQSGDTDGLVNTILSISGVDVACLFMEKSDGIKISFRSKGEYFVNELAATHFSGGGHKYAAGGFFAGSLEEAISKFKMLIPNYFTL
jgi:phosphoesterase RecJ-like protein